MCFKLGAMVQSRFQRSRNSRSRTQIQDPRRSVEGFSLLGTQKCEGCEALEIRFESFLYIVFYIRIIN
jgi:hypothetical protein